MSLKKRTRRWENDTEYCGKSDKNNLLELFKHFGTPRIANMRRDNPFKMTDKQYLFVRLYLMSGDLIAAKAYRKAYPNCKSKAAARASASRLLRTNPNINAYIQDIGKKLRF